jgi:hypothetical protein
VDIGPFLALNSCWIIISGKTYRSGSGNSQIRVLNTRKNNKISVSRSSCTPTGAPSQPARNLLWSHRRPQQRRSSLLRSRLHTTSRHSLASRPLLLPPAAGQLSSGSLLLPGVAANNAAHAAALLLRPAACCDRPALLLLLLPASALQFSSPARCSGSSLALSSPCPARPAHP